MGGKEMPMNSEQLAWRIRRHVIEMTNQSHAAHTGSALSVADILAVLYSGVLRYDAKNPGWAQRDLLVLSKGHASAALYAALAESGFFPVEELLTHCQDGSRLSGHVSHTIPGVECSTGSLGHGFGMASGMAYALRKSGRGARVFTILGDGECNEGSVWETAMLAARLGLRNLTAVVDYNQLQGLDRCDSIMCISPLVEKWSAFGWSSVEVNGHDHAQLRQALMAQDETRPTAVIADTIKGYPISFMESQVLWHYRFPHDGWEYAEAVFQLGQMRPPGITDPYEGREGRNVYEEQLY